MLDRTGTSLSQRETAKAQPAPRTRSSMHAPFRVRSFRFQWPADLLTSWAFEMETIILGWYVLVETKSVVWLTLFGASQYLGTLIAPLYGVAGDRLGHKSLLLAMRSAYAVFASTILIFILLNQISPMVVIVITLMMGLVRPSDLGVRSALIAESMPADTLVSALSMSRTTQDSARIVGALAGASVVVFFGMAPAYLMIAGFYTVGALLMLGDTEPVRHITMAMTPEELEGKSPWRDLKEGLAHTWNTPILLALVSLAFLTNLSAFPLTNGLMPYVAKDVFHIDQTGLGYLVASFAVGSLLGSLLLSHVSSATRLTRLMMASSSLWYVLLIVFAQAPTPLWAVPFLIMAGVMQSFSMVSLQITLLRESGERFRGRVMGVRMMAIYSLPLGLLAAGQLIGVIGYGATATLYALVGLLFTVLISWRWRADLWRA
jgi:MFS family permease